MSDIKPLVVVLDDKFNGIYSGGKWTAWNMCYVPSKIFADEKECADFFSKPNLIYGRGETPQEAIDDLRFMLNYGNHMTIERIKPVNESTEDEEEEKMEPTSVWKIENIDKIWITQDGDEMSFLVKNKDDLTKIILTGDAIKNHNDMFITTLKADPDENEKEFRKQDQKIKELKETIKKLEHDDMLDKDAADYWSKEHDNLLERFAKLQVENEKYKEVAERRFNKKLHDFEVNNKKYDGAIMEEILKRNSGRYPLDDEKSSADNVNHPSHYTGKYECIDVMQDVFGDEATNDFCLCNAFKYIWRACKKNGLEDVKKAIWYLKKYLELTEKEE